MLKLILFLLSNPASYIVLLRYATLASPSSSAPATVSSSPTMPDRRSDGDALVGATLGFTLSYLAVLLYSSQGRARAQPWLREGAARMGHNCRGGRRG